MKNSNESLRKRKLLTIFASDVADYTRLIAQDERTSLQQLGALRRVMDEVFQERGGTIANTAGDSVVASFESPVDAVEAAAQIQARLQKINEILPTNQRMHLRIGINIGDVEHQKNGDLLGHGVNVAARLEQLAAPGGFCLSENVFEQVQGKLNIKFSKVGEHFVKNLEQPIRVYSVGSSEVSVLQRIQHHWHKLSRSSGYQAVFASSVIALMMIAGWSSYLENRRVKSSDIVEIIDSDPPREELLSSFDLVTHGYFDGSDYYIIRTWELDVETLDKISKILGGHIVAIGSRDENDFLFELSIKDEGHWTRANEQYSGPMIDLFQRPDSEEPDEGWVWSNEEPTRFLNWKSPGPDNWGGSQSIAQFRNIHGHRPVREWDDIGGAPPSVIFEVPRSKYQPGFQD